LGRTWGGSTRGGSTLGRIDRYPLSLVEVYKPHIIAITESWCNSDIFDSELSIPDHDLFRMDRPLDNKDGGVLLYVSGDLGAVE